MRLISHRGNINGPEPEFENLPIRIDHCIELGFDVEIDLWKIDDKLFLGHDEPVYEINLDFLMKRKDSLWVHCKNLEALDYLNLSDITYFWHQGDDYTLTSKEYIWTYPKKNYDKFFGDQVILDFSENVDFEFYKKKDIFAVCCDYLK